MDIQGEHTPKIKVKGLLMLVTRKEKKNFKVDRKRKVIKEEKIKLIEEAKIERINKD